MRLWGGHSVCDRLALQLTSIEVLNHRGLRSLRPLGRIVRLEELRLTGCAGLSELEPLCVELRRLDLRGCSRITNISPLQACTKLQDLDVFGCKVTSLQPVSGLGMLTRLSADRCTQIHSLEGVQAAGCKSPTSVKPPCPASVHSLALGNSAGSLRMGACASPAWRACRGARGCRRCCLLALQ